MANITLKDGRLFYVYSVTPTELTFKTDDKSFILGIMEMAENGEMDGYSGIIDGQYVKCCNRYDHITITPTKYHTYDVVLSFSLAVDERIASLESENAILLEYAQVGKILLGEDVAIGGEES